MSFPIFAEEYILHVGLTKEYTLKVENKNMSNCFYVIIDQFMRLKPVIKTANNSSFCFDVLWSQVVLSVKLILKDNKKSNVSQGAQSECPTSRDYCSSADS